MRDFLKKVMTKATGKSMVLMAGVFLFVGTFAVNFCAVPFWHNEPAMPESLYE